MIPTKKPIPQKQQPVTPGPPVTPAPEDEPVESKSGSRMWIWVVVSVLVVAGIVFIILKSENDRREAACEEAERLYEELAEIEEAEWAEYKDSVVAVTEVENVAVYEEVPATEEAAPAAEAPLADFNQGTEDIVVRRDGSNAQASENANASENYDDDRVFTSVEQMPSFPGGEAELLKYISSQIKYPAMAMENNVQGRVVVQFVVNKDGSVGEVKVARGKDPDLDREAVRVVKTLPRFNPGKMNGKPVRVWYILPVNFKLQAQ